ncbi:MAG: dipicolinate synthase subunit DpsA [Firmicutes bacterium]|nr:dipicolinate synthase subunit DpsA [Bacillota bacterium]
MSKPLAGRKVAFLGGGLREVELAKALQDDGAEVRVSSFQAAGQIRLPMQEPKVALSGADALILPVSGVTAEGMIKEAGGEEGVYIIPELLALLKPGAPVVVGKTNPYLSEALEKAGCNLIELVEDDEFAVLNAIPTAEGALVVAIESSGITLAGSKCFVLGFGRCGRAISRRLLGLGAEVHVLERSGVGRALATEMGVKVHPFTDIKKELPEADFIFNTVPCLVLTTDVLEILKKEVLIVDIASAPGGVDFAAAKSLGIQAVLALGLPGKYAPKTAGQILARIVPRKIAEFFR